MDLRDWLGEVDEQGKLKIICGAHWDLEAIGVVGVTMVAQHSMAASQLAAVSIRQRYAGLARDY